MSSRPDDDNPLRGLHPDDLDEAWRRRGLDLLSDDRLLASACELLGVAHEEAADSFRLHAPLELMARAELLTAVSPAAREASRRRIAEIACTWATTGTPIERHPDADAEHDLDELAAAVRDGDPDSADRAFVSLCARRDQDEIVGDLVDLVLPHLGGAAHGSIFLQLLRRFRPAGGSPALMGRTLIRDLAAHPDWRLTWLDRPRPDPSPDASLTERLISPTVDRTPDSHFVHPTMSVVDESGLALELLGDVTPGVTVEGARRDLLRVAAWSMIQDDPDHAPYGWSHCLTLPQAALSVADRSADPGTAVDVAATYVLGFRATQSSTPIDPDRTPDRPGRGGHGPIVELEPAEAVAVAWHADAERRRRIVGELVDHAAPHHDAHLAKYTLACLDAARLDPEADHLFLAAAAHLGAWWRRRDSTG